MDSPELSRPDSEKKPEAKTCPHLGLFSDPQTLIANADPRNYCHMVYPPRAIFLSHQEAFCLKKNYENCEIIICEGIGVFPELLVEDADPRARKAIAGKKARDKAEKKNNKE